MNFFGKTASAAVAAACLATSAAAADGFHDAFANQVMERPGAHVVQMIDDAVNTMIGSESAFVAGVMSQGLLQERANGLAGIETYKRVMTSVAEDGQGFEGHFLDGIKYQKEHQLTAGEILDLASAVIRGHEGLASMRADLADFLSEDTNPGVVEYANEIAAVAILRNITTNLRDTDPKGMLDYGAFYQHMEAKLDIGTIIGQEGAKAADDNLMLGRVDRHFKTVEKALSRADAIASVRIEGFLEKNPTVWEDVRAILDAHADARKEGTQGPDPVEKIIPTNPFLATFDKGVDEKRLSRDDDTPGNGL